MWIQICGRNQKYLNSQSCPSQVNVCPQIQIQRSYGDFIISIIYILIQLQTQCFHIKLCLAQNCLVLLNSCKLSVQNTQENIK